MADRQVHLDTAKLYTDLAELRTAMIGIDGKNGLRGEFKSYSDQTEQRIRDINHNVRDLHHKFEHFYTESRETRADIHSEIAELSQLMHDYFNFRRQDTCHGLPAVSQLRAEINNERRTAQAQHDRREAEDRQHNRTLQKQRWVLYGVIGAALIHGIIQLIVTYIPGG